MKNKNVKVVDEHNIDRNANVMFAIELDGSEYVVYWIERDEASNNVFVSKVLKNIDSTYNMVNIDDEDKKKEIAEIVKVLISTSVSDQNDKMVGTTLALSNGKAVKFLDVSFNKEQNINVSKTYITTVKKEVTKVAETYYDVVVEEAKVADVLPSVTPVVEPVTAVFPELETPATVAPVVEPAPVAPTPVVVAPVEVAPTVVVPATPEVVVAVPEVTPTVVEPVIAQPSVEPVPVAVAPAPVVEPVIAPQPTVAPVPVTPTPVVVAPEPVVPAAVEQPLVFNATKETNLNAALGEVANSATIPVENIQPVREFGVETPVAEPVVTPQPAVAPTPAVVTPTNNVTPAAGFANSKFFMVVAVAFFLASCIFLGYEVYNYFQLVK